MLHTLKCLIHSKNKHNIYTNSRQPPRNGAKLIYCAYMNMYTHIHTYLTCIYTQICIQQYINVYIHRFSHTMHTHIYILHIHMYIYAYTIHTRYGTRYTIITKHWSTKEQILHSYCTFLHTYTCKRINTYTDT